MEDYVLRCSLHFFFKVFKGFKVKVYFNPMPKPMVKLSVTSFHFFKKAPTHYVVRAFS